MKLTDFISIITLIGVAGTFLSGLSNMKKYQFEKNRDLNLKKLERVYAPLYSHLVKQELVRGYLPKEFTRNSFPIFDLVNRAPSVMGFTLYHIFTRAKDEPLFIDRTDIINIVKENKELSSHLLLKRVSEYEVLIYIRECILRNSAGVDVEPVKKHIQLTEKLIVDEIVLGYKKLIVDLKLEEQDSIARIDQFYEKN
ncbi:hypothetical protein [Paenibacillus herberti]|uniref:Uncharacterized protein n=1 Tax=Paenibacillus herberti TaxID=1619309 RepID=A0A229P5K3_9BACL|nr:hypothetical protein [Paenibacillus herberti]OXM17331.1 hypothetical protein CGZ75_12215 [Paenibacillus herberti]